MKLLNIFSLLVIATMMSWLQPAGAWSNVYDTNSMTVTVTEKFQKNNGSTRHGVSEEGSNGTSRGIQYIIADHTRYELLETTTFQNRQGGKITADEVPVPSKALISFQILKSGNRNLENLKVLRKLSSSTTDWSENPAD